MKRFFAVPLCLLLSILAGCGGADKLPLIPVTGTLTMDGKPLADVSVTFYPESGRSASGVTDQEGKFQLTTYDTNDGAVVGVHKAALTQNMEDVPEVIPEDYDYSASGVATEDLLPEKYVNPETSGLQYTIVGDEDTKTVTIAI